MKADTRVRVTALEAAMKANAAGAGSDASNRSGQPIEYDDIHPWHEPVDGATLLSELVKTLRCYVILTGAQADAIALWAAFTHVHDAGEVSPRLIVKSPQMRSGKTTLFSALDRVVAKPRGASGITAPALLRVIEMHHPTMLVDEVDTLIAADKDMAQALRGLLNSGFNRKFATYTMCVPTGVNGHEFREFSTWTPLALAGIGNLPETVRDRSIEIEMQRKLTTETVCRLRRRDGADLDKLARRLMRWAKDTRHINCFDWRGLIVGGWCSSIQDGTRRL